MDLKRSEGKPKLKYFGAVSKTTDISFISLNVSQKQYQGVQLDLIQHHIKFHTDQLKTVRENEAKQLWPCDPQPRSRLVRVV